MANLPVGAHYSFDFGALDFLRASVQKTVKTACGLRVPVSRVNNTGVCMCRECRRIAKQKIDDSLEMARSFKDWHTATLTEAQEATFRELALAAIEEAERLDFAEYFVGPLSAEERAAAGALLGAVNSAIKGNR